ncbi:MAG TPA: type I DNA topoisomerase, partial [bacterium]|nr:type I DNA topoisomerase [bacterium]
MAKKLIIVESPAKARTLKTILGSDFQVESSVGHIRDLPRSRFGVNVEKDFQPEYVTISGKQKVVNRLKKVGREMDEIYLAADPDREGEAICWHLQHYLEDASSARIQRILYYEITRQAILNSLKKPLTVDLDKVNAQQARRVLDRIVGYRLSPLLWKKVRRGLSAGRVQSVALRLIVDREREIEAFEPEEYWTIVLDMKAGQPPEFKAAYYGSHGKKARIPDSDRCDRILTDIGNAPYRVVAVERKRVQRKPSPPFITSTLQQDAARRFRFPAQKTMRLAQSLYEGKDMGVSDMHGLITYMRTDSPRISREAQADARNFIQKQWGDDYVPAKPPYYRARKSAQEAHEAIRPTQVSLTPDAARPYLTNDEFKLYSMIWERFVASQMEPAVVNTTTVKIGAGPGEIHEFRATGSEIVFQGHYTVTGLPRDIKRSDATADDDDTDSRASLSNQQLPTVAENESLTCLNTDAAQNFTKPPARYSEATLVKELEARGIGRPSTYATIMATIRNNDYAEIKDRRFHPTELGMVVVDMLVKNFPEILSVKFTADMEDRLDAIEKGNTDWQKIIAEFYGPFQDRVQEAEETTRALKHISQPMEGVNCPECNAGMVIRWGKKGRFLSCERYPECKGILPYQTGSEQRSGTRPRSLTILLPVSCRECGAPLALKKGRYGLFVSCSKFPRCKG